MNIADLHWRAIITLVRQNSDYEIRYDDQLPNQIVWVDYNEEEWCRIIAPVRLTHENHQDTLASIHVSGDYAAITFQDPDEKIVHTYGEPINLRSS